MPNKKAVLKSLKIEDLASTKQTSAVDLQGWNSESRLLLDCVDSISNPLIVEVGVWKGGSSLKMAEILARKKSEGVVISIDTFLGSSEHYLQPELLSAVGVGPKDEIRLLRIFLDNIVGSRLQDWIIPLPLDSQSGFELLSRRSLQIDLVHVDAGHHYFPVYMDLVAGWGLLKAGGYMVCDDYNQSWPTVMSAVDDFLKTVDYADFKTDGLKCSFRKVGQTTITDSNLKIDRLLFSHDTSESAILRTQIVQLNYQIRQMEMSLRWRMTEPLQKIKAKLKRP